MPDPASIEPGASVLSTRALGPRLIVTTFVGKVTKPMVSASSEEFSRLVSKMDRPVWIGDARRMTGFEPSTVAMGPRWFAMVKERGGRDCLIVSNWDMVIMAARTMALGLGVRIRNFHTIEEAQAEADRLLDAG